MTLIRTIFDKTKGLYQESIDTDAEATFEIKSNLIVSSSLFVTGTIDASGTITSNAGFILSGTLIYSPTFLTGDYNIKTTDYILAVSASTAVNIALNASSQTGQLFIVKDISGSANVNTPIVVSAPSGHKIDGASTYTLSIYNSSIHIMYFGNNNWGVL